ncbi:MAG: 30S ribosome-binding factor RbfA [Desulfofustis sp. PB-SRB1]|jgi:ribosome-binding factor A|nr:30S ribosome-binding factor RbfA [Desulfofustis sp. PB-SRB1]MBM1003076.1 30S ribosome-binding factor RbfA [Desulfofustis sp. PB-SRB1]HBH29651.1 30S ribosome-binding factor RbfA [Desulfofustis sp.]HBH30616.1 30S ribosome-binding factor RbfA [Desulfofustis sp.]
MTQSWHPKQELAKLGLVKNKPPKRATRVADTIRVELASLLVSKARDPMLREVSISRVELSDDLRHAKVYFTTLSGRENLGRVRAGLDRATGFLRSQLAGSLNLRFTPQLKFHYDDKYEKVEKIERLLNEIATESEPRDNDS